MADACSTFSPWARRQFLRSLVARNLHAGATVTDESRAFELGLTLVDDYRFEVDFHDPAVPSLYIDEPPPLGGGDGPNPARVLGAALGSCLGSSLLFCLRKARIEVRDFAVTVRGTMVRNERQRLRIGSLDIALAPSVAGEDRERMTRCLEVFEDFCTITQSVREGIDVSVHVEPRDEPAAVSA